MRGTSFAAAAFAALALAACGSSSSHSKASSSTSAAASTPTNTSSSTPTATGTGSSSTPTSTSATGTSTSSTSTTAAGGGGSLASFKALVTAQNAQAMALGAALTQALKGLRADSNAQIAAVFIPLGSSLTKEADVLGAIQPPASLKAQYQAEIAAYRALAADVSKVGHDGATNASNAVAQADGAQLGTDALKLQKAEVALKTAVHSLH
ncbi:MAG: hypothetical protein ACYDHH_10870 [Solirubrobacteraceae bacterium]